MRAVMISLFVIASAFLSAYVAPTVTNVTASQRVDGSDIVDIWYNLFDGDGNLCEITLLLSNNGGSSYAIIPSSAYLSGNIGANQSSGTNKHIVWNAGAESYDLNASQFSFKVVAEDGSLPANFVLVNGGTFNNGSSNVTVSSFYIDKYEVTQASYLAVMGSNPAVYGVGDSYPVHRVTWFAAIEYCNRRSIIEALTPCYSYLDYGTDPAAWPSGWQNNQNNHTNFSCNWVANGYRLPTEMEWWFAARGGNLSQNYSYSGSNDVNTVAWYSGNSGNSTHPVGTKPANELGLYDMSGNSAEWSWDIFGTLPTEPQTNPTGPATGSYRVHHGGSFWDLTSVCRIASRYSQSTTFVNGSYGLRVVRRQT